MRTLFGWLVLLALCCGAGYWQAEWTRGVRAERAALRAAPTDLRGREESWGRLLIGRPSGADRIELEELPELQGAPNPPPSSKVQAMTGAPEDLGAAPVQDDFEYVVPSGRVLSKICEDFYGSGRSPIPERVASYNGLASPDSLRAGATLRLPDWEVLFPDGREHP